MYKHIVFLLLLFGSSGLAQITTGDLIGKILDSEGRPISDANVIVVSSSLQGERGAASDDHGFFRISTLPVGIYSLKISHMSYQSISIDNINVQLDKTTNLADISLQDRTLEAAPIIVIGERQNIDPTSTTVGMNISASQFENLPIDRDYQSIIALTPQANSSFLGDEINISGGTGLENAYFIDGMHVTDPFRAQGGTDLPYNFIKEIEVKTGGYQAEYGRALGGIANIITYSGSNTFQGQVFGFYLNDNLTGDKRGLEEIESIGFAHFDVGVSLGGPLIRDKLWFYGSYNPQVIQEDLAIPGIGIYRDKRTSHLFAGKLTWQANDRINLTFNINGDPVQHERIGSGFVELGIPLPAALENPDPFLGQWEEGGFNMSLQCSYTPSAYLLLQGAISRSQRIMKVGPATEQGDLEPIIINSQRGTWAGGYGSHIDRESVRTAARMSGTYFLGDHTLKTGIEFEDNKLLIQEFWRTKNGDPGLIHIRNDSDFRIMSFEMSPLVHNRIPSIYAQDSWHIHHRFTLNYGLRWDGQYFIGSDGTVAKSILDQFQPRIGFIFQPGEPGTQKVSGSYGRYYEQIPSSFSSFYSNYLQEIIVYNHNFYDNNPLENPIAGDTIKLSAENLRTVSDLKGEFFDEFILGYEREVAGHFKFGVRGIYRILGEVIVRSLNLETGEQFLGNPGRGQMSFMPVPKRDYTALEITFQGRPVNEAQFFTSYVLSRAYGNYTGLYFSDLRQAGPHGGNNWRYLEQLNNATGLLPNDRTHIFKFNGSYHFNFGLTLGASFFWQSGTPLNEFGYASMPDGATGILLLQQRGTAGRTPSIWDLSWRIQYRLAQFLPSTIQPTLILDISHIGPRKTVYVDQVHYYSRDGEGIWQNENPYYLREVFYQPPLTLRLGLEIRFM